MRLILLLLSLFSAAYGAFRGEIGGLFIASACSFLLVCSLPKSSDGSIEDGFVGLIGELWCNRWTLMALTSLFLAGGAAIIAYEDLYSFSSGYMWLSALGLVTLTAWLRDRTYIAANNSVVVAGHDPQRLSASQVWGRYDWAIAAFLAVTAIGFRLYRLSDYLPTMHGDEGEMGMLALLAMHGPNSGLGPNPLALFSTAFLDHPSLFHYVQAGAMLLFGESLTALRILSAMIGALCVLLLYAVGRIGWGRAAGFTAGWLMAVSHLYVHYSRVALSNIESVCFMILVILLVFNARAENRDQTNSDVLPNEETIATSRVMSYLLIGLALGVSQYFYYGSRLIPIVLIPPLIILWLEKRIQLVQVKYLSIAALIAYAPLAASYLHNGRAFLNRTHVISAFTPAGLVHSLGSNALWPDDIPQLLWSQIKYNAEFFVRSGDISTFYFADLPGFDPLTVLLFWLGLGMTVALWRRFHEFTLLVWLSLGVLLAGVLTIDPPNGPRLIGAKGIEIDKELSMWQ